jgi:hypothetical protein
MGRGQVEAKVRDDLPSRAAIHGPSDAPAKPGAGVAAPRIRHARADSVCSCGSSPPSRWSWAPTSGRAPACPRGPSC